MNNSALLLLAFFVACSPPFSLCHVSADERAVVQRIKELGGQVNDGKEGDERSVFRVILPAEQIEDSDLAMLKDLPDLRELYLSGLVSKSPPSGKGNVTDKGLAELKSLIKLESLNLCGNRITDVGLKELQTLKQLRSIDLSLTYVTDAGLKELQAFEHLASLRIWDVKITDVGLSHLHPIKTLKQVRLAHSRVSDGGLERLRTAIPGVFVENKTYGK